MKPSMVAEIIRENIRTLEEGVFCTEKCRIPIPNKEELVRSLSELLEQPLASPLETNRARYRILKGIKDLGLRMAVDAMSV